MDDDVLVRLVAADAERWTLGFRRDDRPLVPLLAHPVLGPPTRTWVAVGQFQRIRAIIAKHRVAPCPAVYVLHVRLENRRTSDHHWHSHELVCAHSAGLSRLLGISAAPIAWIEAWSCHLVAHDALADAAGLLLGLTIATRPEWTRDAA